jgi:hypothetical protein
MNRPCPTWKPQTPLASVFSAALLLALVSAAVLLALGSPCIPALLMLLAALALVDVVCWQQLARLTVLTCRRHACARHPAGNGHSGMIFCPHVVFLAQ